MGTLRGASILSAFMAMTVPLMPVQALLLRTSRAGARRMPHWYHRQVCRLVGLRLHVEGEIARNRPVLIVANHTSWLDIPVLSAVAPLSFVAKREVGTWPFVSALARLQRTVFVDRTRRTSVGETTSEIMGRLEAGDTIVLFAEGTSSDGNRVLPFRTALFGAVRTGADAGGHSPAGTVVQTLSIVYTHLHGLPLGRADRPLIGWYGDMLMGGHAWELLKAGPIDVAIGIGPPIPLDTFTDRKTLARHSEDEVRGRVAGMLRAGGTGSRDTGRGLT